MFLMPSRFEPCGLNQMYSLRYGTVPVVRRSAAWPTRSRLRAGRSDATGFAFDDYTPAALLATLRRALAALPEPAPTGGRFSCRACSRTIPGTVRPGSTSKYMSGP